MYRARIPSLATICTVLLVERAFAGGPVVAAPGPIAGVGLLALVLIGGAYWVGRKFFGHKD
jgi:hypothetical protein